MRNMKEKQPTDKVVSEESKLMEKNKGLKYIL